MINYLRVLATWQRLKSLQYRDIDFIRNYQFLRFKKICAHAYENIPMYRELYDNHSFNPSALNTYSDIENVPIITKELVRKIPLEKKTYSKIPQGEIVKLSTSGSTGEPLKIWSDKTEALIASIKGVRVLRAWGYRPWDESVMVWRNVPKPMTSVLQKLGIFKRSYISIMNDPDQKIRELVSKKCGALFASRSSLEILAEELKEREVQIRPKILVSACEVLTKEHRQLFKDTFGTETLEIYGTNEIGNIAWECPIVSEDHNLHVEMETVVVNFNNVGMSENGDKIGSIIATNLENTVMPFIRYDLGDLVQLPKSTKCNCGRNLDVLGRVLGRNDDIVEYQGRKFNWHFFYNYFKDYSHIKKYKIVQLKEGGIVFKVHLFHDNDGERKRCEKDLNSAFKQYFHKVNIQFVNGFPLSKTGKFKVIEKE